MVTAAAKEANDLIEQRTFSWTELFNHLEATLPENVMLTAVRPEFKDGETHVNMDIQGGAPRTTTRSSRSSRRPACFATSRGARRRSPRTGCTT